MSDGDARIAELAARLWPTRVSNEDGDLLRACLAPPAEASEAWRRCLERVALGSRSAASGGAVFSTTVRALLPLLADRLALFDAPAPAWLASQLRAARTIEAHRNQALREIAGAILASPEVARHGPLVLDGLAVAESVWPEPALRHTSEVTLLLSSPRAAIRAARALARAGLVAGPPRGDRVGSAVRLRHPSGMPVILHGGACSAPLPLVSHERLAAHGVTGEVDGVSVLHGSASLCFARTAVAASRRAAGSSLLWLADAVFLLRRAADEIADSELAKREPLLALLAAQLARRAVDVDPALGGNRSVARLLSPPAAADTPANLLAAVAALRGLRQAMGAIPGRWAKLGWLCRLGPPLLATRLRRRLTSRASAALVWPQGM